MYAKKVKTETLQNGKTGKSTVSRFSPIPLLTLLIVYYLNKYQSAQLTVVWWLTQWTDIIPGSNPDCGNIIEIDFYPLYNYRIRQICTRPVREKGRERGREREGGGREGETEGGTVGEKGRGRQRGREIFRIDN